MEMNCSKKKVFNRVQATLLVTLSVQSSVRRSVHHAVELFAKNLNRITVHAHPHATVADVCKALRFVSNARKFEREQTVPTM